MAAYVSSDGVSQVAVSTGSVVKIIDVCSGSVCMTFENQLSPNEEDNKQKRSSEFICHSFSSNGEYFAAITEDKKLLVWTVKDKSLDCSYNFAKRPTYLDFCHHEDTVVVADKYGDVFKCGYKSAKGTGPSLLLGHLSMLLSIKMSKCDKFIVSADRDEKIRISCYPNSYSIHSYCLGHSKLVSCLLLLDDDVLLSCSPDSTVRVWNFKDGTNLQSLDVGGCFGEKVCVISQVCRCGDLICMVAEGSTRVLLIKYACGKLSLLCTKDMGSNPLSIASVGSEKVIVLLKQSHNPLVLLEKQENDISVRDDYFDNSKLNVNTDDLVVPLFYTHLIKPVKGKRPNATITPESTINMDSQKKVARLDECDIIEE